MQLKHLTASEAELQRTVKLQRQQVDISWLVVSCHVSDFVCDFSSVTHQKMLRNWKKRELYVIVLFSLTVFSMKR